MILLGLGLTAQADENKHFKVSLNPSQAKVKAGEKFIIRINFDFDKYWYTYSMKEQVGPEGLGPMQTEVVIKSPEFIEMNGSVIMDKPHVKHDEAYKIDIEYFNGKFKFDVPVKAKKNINFKKDKIKIEIYIQQCDTNSCLPGMPFIETVSAKPFKLETVEEAVETPTVDTATTTEIIEDRPVVDSAAAAPAEQDTDQAAAVEVKKDDGEKDIEKNAAKEVFEVQKTDDEIKAQEAKESGVFSYILFAMGWGFLGLLTPCVYPMIPITVSFFTKRSEKNGGKGVKDAFFYSLGIMLTFTGIGVVVAAIYGQSGIGDLASSPFLNLGIAALFIVFALNLFGAFEIGVPTGIINKLNMKTQSGGGIASVLLMGLVFSLTSFTCTVPFVSFVLVDAADGLWFWPILGMLGYSFVFAVPFFFLALFPSFIKSMPKSGGWMNNMKVVLGFLEFAFAMKFLSNVDLSWGIGIMPRNLFIGTWLAAGALIVIYLLGMFKMKLDSDVDRIGGARILFVIFFTSVTFWLFSGFNDKPLGMLDAFLPPSSKAYGELMGGEASAVAEEETDSGSKDKYAHYEFDDYAKALKVAKELNRPMFIDFTGVTCTNCRLMEQNMFIKSSIASRLEKFIKVKLYTDRKTTKDKANQAMQQERFHSITLPLYVVQTPDEKVIANMSFTHSEPDFRAFLDKGLKK